MTDDNIHRLTEYMIEYYAGDPKRIQHFIKVHAFARLIALGEGLPRDQVTLTEAAALVHDIGIKPAEQKYGSCSGKYQELEGPAPARKMLEKAGFTGKFADRVCYLVAHHHTYTSIDGDDYQILVEADFLVNLYEDGVSRSAISSALEQIFRTKTGRLLCQTIFGI